MTNEVRDVINGGELGGNTSSGETPGVSPKPGEVFRKSLLRDLEKPGSTPASLSAVVSKGILDPLEAFDEQLPYTAEEKALIRRYAGDARRLIMAELEEQVSQSPLLALDIGLFSLEKKYSDSGMQVAVVPIQSGRRNLRKLQANLQDLFRQAGGGKDDNKDGAIIDRICETKGKHPYRKNNWFFQTELGYASLSPDASYGNLFEEMMQTLRVVRLKEHLEQTKELAKTKHAAEGSESINGLHCDLFLDPVRAIPLAVVNITGLAHGDPTTSNLELKFSRELIGEIIKSNPLP